MYVRYYGPLLLVLARLTLPLAGCGSDRPATAAMDPATGSAPPRRVAAVDRDPTDQTIWTVLGLARRPTQNEVGPQTGASVSPVLWEAAHDTLNFAGFSSEDPVTGTLVTKWYSPAGKPSERLRVSVFILSRALRSDSLATTVERQEQGPGGAWNDTPIAKDVVTALENTILLRARQIHAERYRDTMYN